MHPGVRAVPTSRAGINLDDHFLLRVCPAESAKSTAFGAGPASLNNTSAPNGYTVNGARSPNLRCQAVDPSRHATEALKQAAHC